jgi:hypothetical protein
MATNSMVPYSNPAGNNQTNPLSGAVGAVPAAMPLPGATPSTTANVAATSNPLVPTTTGAATPSLSTLNGDLSNELSGIFGSGVGNLVNNFMGGVSGTDSTILQEYTQSLVPQEAKAQADTNAALGAGGVSANSSVAAIADSNLQAQETASIAGESAQLTMAGEQMDASMIQSMLAPAENATTESKMMPWEILGAGVGAVGNVAGAAIKAFS